MLASILTILALIAQPDLVDLRVRLVGPNGPLADISMRAEYGKNVTQWGQTDADGWATFHLDRNIDNRVEVSPSVRPTEEPESVDARQERVSALWARFAGLSVPPPVLCELPAGSQSVEKQISLPAGAAVNVGPVLMQDGSHPFLATLCAFQDGVLSTYQRSAGIVRLESVPLNTSAVYLMWAESSERTRYLRIEMPALTADTALGEVHLPAAREATGHIKLKRHDVSHPWPARAYAGVGGCAVTLVSSDGIYIMDALFASPPKEGTITRMIDVPPGTYFALPGLLMPVDFQEILIHKLMSGVDLTAHTDLPHVTVAAGETKDLDYSDVDVINAIYALPQ